jgi:predicted 3-demethylubiquinone-9 3-methyltransferase (glyoxalase superfamily)
MQKITPCLWFNGRVEEALDFYISIFRDAKIKKVSHYGEGAPMPAGSVLTAVFEIEGQEFMILNGGPHFTFSEAISFVVHCKDQQEVDYYWDNLLAGGGKESMCGWLKDKFGLSWQIVPLALNQLMSDKDPKKAERVMHALMKMVKLDVAKLEEAAKG